jgi:hypothetical protein
MPTAIPQVELTVIEQGGVEVLVLDAPGAQVAVGPAISTATPQPLGTAAAGTTGEAADAGHSHAHGNLAGGALHAVASTSAAGFMSAAQFDLLTAATDQDTASTLVKRDASGDFEANIITAALDGNAATATKLATARNINGVAFDGTGNITITANPNSHVHGNISNDGKIGSTAGLPIVTGTAGVLEAGAFGTTAGTFAEGDDSRFDGPRDPNVGSVTNESVASDAAIALTKLANGTLPSGITIASSNIVDGTIVDADIDAAAAIALSKLATGALPTAITIANANVASNAAIALTKLANGGLPTGITIATDNILDGTIVNADINDSAAIAPTKIAGTAVVDNDARLTNERVPTNDSVTNAKVASNAAIALSKLATGALPTAITIASANIVDGTIVDADINASAAIGLSKLATGALPTAITVASANLVDGTIVDTDVNASAAIAGTKIAPNFGSQNVLTTGTITGASLTVTGSSVPANGIYRPAANTLGIATNNTERIRVLSTGDIAIGGTGLAGVNISLQQAIGGSATRYVVVSDGTIQSTATNAINSFRSQLAVQDSVFSINAIEHFHARQGTFGSSATVTSQTGFFAASQLVGAQNNYGFFGALSAATGRWNFYASGTAPNYFEGGVRTNGVLTARAVPVNSNSSTTATATSLRDGMRTGTPTANIDLQLPTGTNMDAAFQELQTNQSFQWSAINLASATHSITVTVNDDHTVVGNMIVPAATTGRFLTRKTAANTFVTYRIG